MLSLWTVSLDSKGLILHALEVPPLSTFVVFPFGGGNRENASVGRA